MSSVVIAGNTSGSVTLAAPDVAGTTVLTLPATSGTVFISGQPLSATTGSFSGNVTLGSSVLATPAGSAPSYLCRAWVNFNGTGTVAIRASGNVSSITDNGTGRYTINFSTAMIDTNYSIVGNYNGNYGGSNVYLYAMAINSFLSGNMTESAPLTTSCEISTYSQAGSTDFKYVNVSIHR